MREVLRTATISELGQSLGDGSFPHIPVLARAQLQIYFQASRGQHDMHEKRRLRLKVVLDNCTPSQ